MQPSTPNIEWSAKTRKIEAQAQKLAADLAGARQKVETIRSDRTAAPEKRAAAVLELTELASILAADLSAVQGELLASATCDLVKLSDTRYRAWQAARDELRKRKLHWETTLRDVLGSKNHTGKLPDAPSVREARAALDFAHHGYGAICLVRRDVDQEYRSQVVPSSNYRPGMGDLKPVLSLNERLQALAVYISVAGAHLQEESKASGTLIDLNPVAAAVI